LQKADYFLTGDITHFGRFFGEKVAGVKICCPRGYLVIFWPNERITVPPLKGTGERLPVVVDKLNMSPYSACKARTALKDDVKLIKA